MRSLAKVTGSVFVAMYVAGAAAACGLGVVGEGTSRDGADGASTDGGALDVSGEGGGAGDGSSLPVGPLPDGGTWCEPGAIFCDDFDDAAAAGPDFGWTRLAAQGGTALAKDDAAAVTPPSSLVTTFTPTASGYLFLREDFTAPSPTRARLAFDLRVDAVGPNRTYVAYIALVGSGATYYLQVFVQSDGVYVSEDLQNGQEFGSFKQCGPPLGMKTWTHLDFSITVGSSPAETLVVDRGAPCTNALTYAGKRAASYTPSIMIGMPYVNMQPGTMTVHHDDVAFYLP